MGHFLEVLHSLAGEPKQFLICKDNLPLKEKLDYFQLEDEETAIELIDKCIMKDDIDLATKISLQWPSSVAVWLFLLEMFKNTAEQKISQYLVEKALRNPGMNLAEGHLIWECLGKDAMQSEIPFYSLPLQFPLHDLVIKHEEGLLDKHQPPLILFESYAREMIKNNRVDLAWNVWQRAMTVYGRHPEAWLRCPIPLEHYNWLQEAVRWCPESHDLWIKLLEATERLHPTNVEAITAVIERAYKIVRPDDKFVLAIISAFARLHNKYILTESQFEASVAKATLYGQLSVPIMERCSLLFKDFTLLSECKPSVALAKVLCKYKLINTDNYGLFAEYAPQSQAVKDAWIEWEELHGIDINTLEQIRQIPVLQSSTSDNNPSKRTLIDGEMHEKEEPDGPANCIFLSNLDYHVPVARIKQWLQEDLCLHVACVRLKRHPDGKSKGYGHARLIGGQTEVDKALAADRSRLDGRPVFLSPFHNNDNQEDPAGKKSFEPDGKQGRTLYVSHLPVGTKVHHLKKLFAPFAGLRDIRLVERKSGRFRGCAYVEFVSARNAMKALDANQDAKIEVEGCLHEVSVELSNPPKSKEFRAHPATKLALGAKNSMNQDDFHEETSSVAPLSNADFRAMLFTE